MKDASLSHFDNFIDGAYRAGSGAAYANVNPATGEVIGEVRGKGLLVGAELVSDRQSKEPAEEAKVQAVVADCMRQGVIIGMTNRSLPGMNNTLCLAPALIATRDDIDEITTAIDAALSTVFG